MEQIKVRARTTEDINMIKFAILQQMAIEYFIAIEENLTDTFELAQSTKYKERFTANNREKRKLEKLLREDVAKFKARSKAYKKKNYDLLSHFDNFKQNDKQKIEEAIERLYDYIDEIIVKDE